MITVTAVQHVIDGKQDELIALMKGLTEEIRANEPGCLRFEHYCSASDPLQYIVIEQYADDDAFRKHQGTTYLKSFIPKLLKLLHREPEVVQYRDIVQEESINRPSVTPTYFHIGVVVRDLKEAMERYSSILGVTFTQPATFHVPEFEDPDAHPFDVVAAFSHQGPPYYELIQASGTGAFSETFADQILYLGVWEHNIPERIKKLQEQGVGFEAILKNSEGIPFVCLTKPEALFGARIEFVGDAARPSIENWVKTGIFVGQVAK